jgi:hypothetical protein
MYNHVAASHALTTISNSKQSNEAGDYAMQHEWHRDAAHQKQADNLRSGPRRFPLQSLGVLNANVFVLSIDVALNSIQVACILLFRDGSVSGCSG